MLNISTDWFFQGHLIVSLTWKANIMQMFFSPLQHWYLIMIDGYVEFVNLRPNRVWWWERENLQCAGPVGPSAPVYISKGAGPLGLRARGEDFHETMTSIPCRLDRCRTFFKRWTRQEKTQNISLSYSALLCANVVFWCVLQHLDIFESKLTANWQRYGHSRQPRPWPGACLMTQGHTNHQTGPVCMGFWRITAVWDGANKMVGSHWCCVGACLACFAKHKYKHHVVIQQRLSVFASMLASWRHKFYRAGAVSAAQTQHMEEETVLEIKFPRQWFILYAVGSCLYRGTSFLLRAKLFLNLSLSNPYFEIWRKCSSKKPVESALAPQA